MEQTKIKHIESGEILDSRGNPTVMTTVVLSSGATAAAAVPSGASCGEGEAFELRDGVKTRYGGLGVLKACSNVNVKIAPALFGMDGQDQIGIDKKMIELDGTENKSNLGANAILSVSLAVSRAVSVARGIPLYESIRQTFGLQNYDLCVPTPIMNLINGGKHASTNISLQEFQIIPYGFKTCAEKIQAGSEIFHALGEILKKQGLDFDVGDEGGYAPHVESIEFLFETLVSAIKSCGMEGSVGIGLDIAANSFYSEGGYDVSPPEKRLDFEHLFDLYFEWMSKYPILCIEDPFEEDSWNKWEKFCFKARENGIIVIGDDLIVTNKFLLEKAIKQKSVTGTIIKPNQAGTLTETIEAILCAKENNIKVVVSHRSGETNDSFISDLAVSCGAEFLKAGAPSRGERVAKYNRLMEIEKTL